jgi:hypothetical protein
VLSDLDKFSNVITNIQKSESIIDELRRIVNCYEFVIDFNWRGLMKVEREIFFPWLSDLLPESSKYYVKQIFDEHSVIINLSEKLKKFCTFNGSTEGEVDVIKQRLRSINEIIMELKESALRIQKAQVMCLIILLNI